LLQADFFSVLSLDMMFEGGIFVECQKNMVAITKKKGYNGEMNEEKK